MVAIVRLCVPRSNCQQRSARKHTVYWRLASLRGSLSFAAVSEARGDGRGRSCRLDWNPKLQTQSRRHAETGFVSQPCIIETRERPARIAAPPQPVIEVDSECGRVVVVSLNRSKLRWSCNESGARARWNAFMVKPVRVPF